jgi:hypothetical protein
MRVFIANFGRGNYDWPVCLARNAVATMDAEAAHSFWVQGDRDGYVNYCIRHFKTAAGITPTRPVASRWFNLMTVVAETSADIWIHREKDELWWALSKSDPPTITLEDDPNPLAGAPRVYVCRKPCDPWSNKSELGVPLLWKSLHPKAADFLFTEGTLQQLSNDNATYALALINETDLSPWHSRPAWRARVAASGRSAATIFNPKQRAAVRMAMIARGTAAGSNGQSVLRTVKNKEIRFQSEAAFEKYISALIDLQEGLCAITGIPLQYDGEYDDVEMLCSLDRIDSTGHYEVDNFQVVCRFVNRWKNDGEDADFRRLISVVRSSVS